MSFKSINSSSEGGLKTFKSFAKMSQGESVVGYLVGLPEGKFGTNITLETETGHIIELAPAGDLKYYLTDVFNPGESKDLLLNVLTQVVCLGKRKIKTGSYAGKETTAGDILQDVDRVKPGTQPSSVKKLGKAIAPSSDRTAVMTKEEEAAEAETVVRRAKDIMARAGKANG